MEFANYYTTYDLADLLKYSSKNTILNSMKNAKPDTLSGKLWATKLNQKIGKNWVFDKIKVDRILREYKIC